MSIVNSGGDEMYATQRRKLSAVALIFLVILACNYPKPPPATPDNSGTAEADTLASIETGDAFTQAAAFAGISSTAIPGTIPAGSATLSGSQRPLVVQDSLRWVGPGNQ